MSDKHDNNAIEEGEIEESPYKQNEEEYEEENANQAAEEEEGQEFTVAFDIQINDISYILLIGKTEESKLILRLIDKEDDTKPFYQNEFSLDELKEINNYFLNFTNENEAIDSIIKNLNENDKEIEILDENNIKLTVQINEEGGTNIDFILPKLSYELEGEEEQVNRIQNAENKLNNKNVENNDMNKDEIEEVENENENIEEENYKGYMEHEEANLEYSDENAEKQEENYQSPQKQNIENKKQNMPNVEENIQKQNIIENKQKKTLTNILEDNEENNLDNNKKQEKENIDSKEMKKEKEEEKEEEKNGEETKISRVIEELKNNLDSLGGAMNYIEQDEEEQNHNENENLEKKKFFSQDFTLFKNEIFKMFNQISETLNGELKKQNDFIKSQQKIIKDENDKTKKDLLNKLNMKYNEINNIKTDFNKVLNEKINNLQNETKKEINKLNDEIKLIKNQENTPSKKYDRLNNDNYRRNNNEMEKFNNNINLKIKDIEQKMNSMKNEINKNNKNNDNINIRSLIDKVNMFENRLKRNDEILSNNTRNINEKKNNIDNKMMSLETKLSNLETSIKERKNFYERISALENKSKTFDNKINNLENNKNVLNDYKEIIERLNTLENITKVLETERNESELNNVVNKVNNLINLVNNHEKDIKDLTEAFNNIIKTLPKSSSKTFTVKNQPKDSNELYQQIDISSDENRKPTSSITKQPRSQKQSQYDLDRNNMASKNYRIIRQFEKDSLPEKKKYESQTFNRGYQLTSHSVNRLNIRPDKDNNSEYQTNTKPRSRSKGHKKKKNKQNKYEAQSIQKKYITKNYSYSNTNVNQYNNGIDESNIIQEDDIIFIENRLSQIYPNNDFNFNLVYRATEDGDKSSDFHKSCDKIGPNITFIKTRNGFVFGGFTIKNWEHLKRDININKPNLGSASRDPNAFGFSVNYQKIYENERKNEFAIWCNRNYGPTFKNNFFQIFDNALQKGGYCSSRQNSHFGGQKSDYEISGGEPKFKIDEIEVFEIIFE